MNLPSLSIIAAVSKNGVIGADGKIPWKMPSDLRRFKEMTGGHAVVFGTKTYISLPLKLENRAVIVYSRREKPRMLIVRETPAFFTDNLEEILPIVREAKPDISLDEIFIGGGEGIYEAFMSRAERMYITEIDCEVIGDTHFPKFGNEWTITQELHFDPQPGDQYASTFRVYERSR